MDRLIRARNESEVAATLAAADDWLAANPSDGDVRAARDQLREAMPQDDTELEEGSPT
jgi:hypothetical protein